MQPSAIRLTFSPDDPSRTCSMPLSLSSTSSIKAFEAVANQALLIHALTGPVTAGDR